MHAIGRGRSRGRRFDERRGGERRPGHARRPLPFAQLGQAQPRGAHAGVVGAQRRLEGGDHPLVQPARLHGPLRRLVQRTEFGQGPGDARPVARELLFLDRKRALEQRLGIPVVAARGVELRQVVEYGNDGRTVDAELRLAQFQREEEVRQGLFNLVRLAERASAVEVGLQLVRLGREHAGPDDKARENRDSQAAIHGLRP